MFTLGGKKIDTKTKYVNGSKALINERFAMKTILDYNEETEEYLPKPVLIIHFYIFSHYYNYSKEILIKESS